MAVKKILIINPNSLILMGNYLDSFIRAFTTQYPSPTQIESYTAPSGPPSIDNDGDALTSSKAVMADLQFKLDNYDAYLVACYSVHPLVWMLTARVPPHVYVTGIFEASISTALSFLPLGTSSKFGIVSTGTYWEKALSEGVQKFVGSGSLENERFKGVATTGLNAIDLLTADQEEAKIKLKLATTRLVRDRDVKVICLGCAAMAGLHGAIKEALKEQLGDEANSVHIIDGITAGIALIEGFFKAFPAKG